MSFEVVWHPPAEEDLLHLPWQDAAWVAREVNNLAENGIGDVRIEQLSSGRRIQTARSSPSDDAFRRTDTKKK